MGGGDAGGSMHPRQIEQIPPLKSPSLLLLLLLRPLFSRKLSCSPGAGRDSSLLLLLLLLLLLFCPPFPPPSALFFLFPSALCARPSEV